MSLKSHIRRAITAILICLCVLWLYRQAQMPGLYTIRVHGADSWAGSWNNYLLLRADGTGMMWHGVTPQNWECPLAWTQTVQGIQITIPQYIYGGTYYYYAKPGTHLYHKGIFALKGIGRIENGELVKYGTEFGREPRQSRFRRVILQW